MRNLIRRQVRLRAAISRRACAPRCVEWDRSSRRPRQTPVALPDCNVSAGI